ncbi:MAG: hypothetical protein L7S63_06910 [Flavobacteriales bacterium]|nr:hypothetical protein [Flavobacteriales bacterium]
MAEELRTPRNIIRWSPAIAVLLWWTIRLSTTGRVPFETGISIGVLVHFALLIGVALTAAFQRIEGAEFIDRFKLALRPVVLYALLASVSTVCYHHVVCAQATELRLLERERFIDQSLSDEAAFAVLQENDPALAAMDLETARERAKSSLRFQFDPLWHFTASLLMWIAAAMSAVFVTSLLGQWLRS